MPKQTALFQELVPPYSELKPKTCYISLDNNITHHLINHYLANNQQHIKTNSLYRDIAFACNYVELVKKKNLYFRNYITKNHFAWFDLNYNALNTLDALSGYDSVVICDGYMDFSNYKTLDEMWFLEKIIRKLVSYDIKVYYMMPDLIFEPDKNMIYNADSPANSTAPYKYISTLVFLDQFFTYLKNSHKLPLYRIVYPYFVSNMQAELFFNTTKIGFTSKEFYKQDEGKVQFSLRNFLTVDKMGEFLYRIHNESLPQNYMISGNYYMSMDKLERKSGIESDLKIKLCKGHLEHFGIKDYNNKYYETYIQEIKNINKELKPKRTSYRDYVKSLRE